MNRQMMRLQQYLFLHPIREMKEKYRVAYVSLVGWLCGKHSGKDQWGGSVMALMRRRLADDRELFPVRTDREGNLLFETGMGNLFRYKFHRYRYILLTDCLFVCAFADRRKGKELLGDVCRLFPRNSGRLGQLFDCFYGGDREMVRSCCPDLEKIYGIIRGNRDFLEAPEKRIMITANMSAGKSTLLNALAGKKVNRTQNDTCTAKLHYLYNKAGEDGLSCEWDHDLELDASLDILMEDNEDNASPEIIVGTRFRSLDEVPHKICFIDTPGVNSSQNKEHRELTNRAIGDGNCDLLLFLLNGENMGSDDDRKHIEYVRERYHGRIIFLVNKLDRYRKDTDSVKNTILRMKEDLVRLGYEDPQVYPVSAYGAYLAKMARYRELLTEDELDELDFRKRKLCREEFQYHTYYDIDTPKINEEDELEVLLRNSGILSLEKIIY